MRRLPGIQVPDRPRDLPDFDNPPIVEVALAVQFVPLPGLVMPVLSKWTEVHDRLPKWEQKPVMATVQERFGLTHVGGARPISFQIGDAVPPIRSWFSNPEGTQLVQVQQDCLVRNWRKTDTCPEYPHYEQVRELFVEDYASFGRFVEEQALGRVQPTQCEVTYVNHIELDGLGVKDVIEPWTGTYADASLGTPEGMQLTTHYVIHDADGNPAGRLHVIMQTGVRQTDRAPVVSMNLTARGHPQGDDLDAVLAWFDLGREQIVRGFTSITTSAMHARWKRTQ